MGTARQKTSTSKRPRLVSKEWTETDPDTGKPVLVRLIERGALRRETRKYDLATGMRKISLSPRKRFEVLCEGLRNELEDLGAPSDRTSFWIRNGDGAWVPLDLPPGEYGIETISGFQNWKSRLNELTEPLSVEQTTGELLYQVSQLLARDGIDPHLQRIFALMKAYSDYRLAGKINTLVDQAITGEEARSLGPPARRQRACAVRQVIAEAAEAYWLDYPKLRNYASNTAACLADEVNQRLRSQRLLPANKTGLSTKTIADHIRALRQR